MKIAIIGAGRVGGALGRAWRSKAHDVVFGVRSPGEPKTAAAIAGIGARATGIADAVRDSAVVVLAVPFGAVASAVEAAGELAGKIVIDCTNPGSATLPPGVGSAAEFVTSLSPRARVVKSFNAQGAENIAQPRFGNEVAANFYCGDDAEAKNAVRGLIADVGFDPVDAGSLTNARLLESATLLWFSLSKALGSRHVAFRVLHDS